MSARKAKRPKISRGAGPRLQEVFIRDREIPNDFPWDARQVLETLRIYGRPVHVSEDGGKTSWRVGTMAAYTSDGGIAWANERDPIVLTRDEYLRKFGADGAADLP